MQSKTKFINFIKRFTLTIAMLLGLSITIGVAAYTDFAKKCDKIPSEVFRLHILANSNSEKDQDLKYALRDYILSDLESIFGNSITLEEAKNSAEENIALIEQKANQFVKDMGFDYPVKAEVTKMFFTTRVYENVTLPAGDYFALRLTIGSGEGKNWWCVMFPQLCIPAAKDTGTAFTPETSKIVENGGKVQVKFAVYEWFKKTFR